MTIENSVMTDSSGAEHCQEERRTTSIVPSHILEEWNMALPQAYDTIMYEEGATPM